MKQLLLHIGTHKTGTTAIQNALRVNSRLLAQNGCTYVDEAHELSRRLKEPGLDGDDFATVKQKFNDLLSKAPADKVIFSSEQFAGTILKNYTDSGFIAERLKQLFPDYNSSVIVYFRRQDHFIESAYTQFIQQGQSWSFDRFRDFADFSKFDWNCVVDNYRQHFQSVDIHIYDRSQLIGGDVVIDFFTWLGLPVDSRLRIIRGSNYSWSRSAVEIARVGNEYLDDAARQLLGTILQSRDNRQPYDDNPYFSVQERRALLAHYQVANQQLAAAAGSGMTEAFPCRPDEAAKDMDTATTEFHSDAAIRLLIDICLDQHRVRWVDMLRSLIHRLSNKLKQYVRR